MAGRRRTATEVEALRQRAAAAAPPPPPPPPGAFASPPLRGSGASRGQGHVFIEVENESESEEEEEDRLRARRESRISPLTNVRTGKRMARIALWGPNDPDKDATYAWVRPRPKPKPPNNRKKKPDSEKRPLHEGLPPQHHVSDDEEMWVKIPRRHIVNPHDIANLRAGRKKVLQPAS